MPDIPARTAPPRWRLPTLPLAAVLALFFSGQVAAAPRLRCEVSHAGKTVALLFAPVSDPYTVKSIDIDARFRFKAVMVGNDEKIDYIALYTYDLSTDFAVLLHQAKYLEPRPQEAAAATLTGQQFVYSLKRGREMSYQCALIEAGQ